MRQLVLLCGIIVSSLSAWSASEIKTVSTETDKEAFIAVYSVSEPIDEENLKVNYRPRSIEMVFGNARLNENKSIVRVDHPIVDRVYSANKDGKAFSRIILKEGMVAEDYKDYVSFEVKADKIHLKLAEEKVVPVVEAVDTDLDAALEREVAKILSQDMKMPEKIVAKPVEKKVELEESDIPVLTKAEVKKAETKSPYTRMILSFVVIAFFAAAMTMVSKWWRKRTSKSDDNNKIRVVAQHFLGPRKSLAIIRVAGENMLVGITDSNINMIKSLSLLDEDSMDSIDTTKSFGEVLESRSQAVAEAVEDEEEDFSFKQIKDRISNRVKEMRPL